MFLRTLQVTRITLEGEAITCPIAQIDNFAMRNFTNDAVFDDTLPIADGLLEVGTLVPLDLLHVRMDGWFRRKGYLTSGEYLRIDEITSGK